MENLEIERKFLVIDNSFMLQSTRSYPIVQGYLSTDPKRNVRVRLKGDKGFLTIKGETSADGLSRMEWEREISKDDALLLLKLSLNTPISKTRYEVPFDGFVFEVDVFHLNNNGLILAEIELNSADDCFPRPLWLGREVTGDIRYYNSYLSQK